MYRIKRIAAAILALSLLALMLPVSAVDSEPPGERIMHDGLFIDTDPAGGYTGDYVVVYNPSSDTTSGATTGSLAGLIDTTIDPGFFWNASGGGEAESIHDPDMPAIIDVDSELAAVKPDLSKPAAEPERTNWGVGATKTFPIYNYSPTGSAANIQFKVLYVGAHCRVWTCTNQSYVPLDYLSTYYAQYVANEFDAKYPLMSSSFGSFYDSNGDGKVNILFYNIEDGWSDFGQAYVAGYFWSGDYYYSALPMIHIDTWPGLIIEQNGSLYSDITKCYGTLVHEFQHLINYSVTGGMHSWLNESFSGAAEEICYPGSALYTRIQSWQNHDYQYYEELYYPVEEYAYSPSISLHKGGSLAYWNNSENTSGLLARYAGVLFFSQYLATRYGNNTIFKRIMSNCHGDSVADSLNALTSATGWSLDSIWRDYAISMIANDPASGYGFVMNEGYDPTEWMDPDEYPGFGSLYNLLPAVLYNSTNATSIQGGGFITIKPLNGVFNPPSGASSKLKYVGISFPDYLPGDVNNDGRVDTEDALLALRCALGIIQLSSEARWRADLDFNGVIDTTDALLILRRALGIH